MNIYKSAADSFNITKGDSVGKTTYVGTGTRPIMVLSKTGLRNADSPNMWLFFVTCAKAQDKGYDYVVLSSARTNSGRPEPIKFATKSTALGRSLIKKNTKFEKTNPLNLTAELKIGDVFIPTASMPMRYDDIPEYVPPKQKNSCLPDQIAIADSVGFGNVKRVEYNFPEPSAETEPEQETESVPEPTGKRNEYATLLELIKDISGDDIGCMPFDFIAGLAEIVSLWFNASPVSR